MPTALHPQAKFDPIPPDLDLHALVDRTPNFKWVQRVSRAQIRNLGQQGFEKLVHIHVIAGGKPLVIDGWEAVLPKWLFSAEWLEKTYDKKQENVRDIPAANDIPMTMGHYLRSMKQLTNQWNPHTFRDERRQRLYLKDVDCPPEWRDALQKTIHPSLFYLNENTSTATGANRQDDSLYRGETIAAPAGDLMSSLPEAMRAENLMCYIGHEGTYTPAHSEMCASLGQNIMVEASIDGGGEKAGSSIWFMTESKDREVVREYFLSMLGHDIEIEKHFAQINAWKKAPFEVSIVEQRPGDFILIPPLAAHQVWNRGSRTMKVAWNRTTVETLELALHEALPKARLVCRDEQYRNKAIIFYTLQKYFRELQEMEENAEMAQISFMGIGHENVKNSPSSKHLASDFKKLFGLFSEILVDEVFAFKEKEVEFLPFDACVTCSYCRSNIFNRFLTCKHCVRTLPSGDEDAYDVCMECYAMGRSCACLSGLQWCEQWQWSELVENYEAWRAMVIISDGYIDTQTSPPPLDVARQKSGKKSLAQICQEALRRRPWKDITKPERQKTPSDSEPGDGDETTKKKPKRKKKKGELRRCHVCCHKDYTYRVHECTNPGCTEAYCYGVLYRAFDMMPQKVLEDEYWQCPKCLGICSCGACRRSGNTNAYTPRNTLLGHDTRPIADDRSVEALVDFRIHNLSWLKAVGEESRSKDSRRMQRLREQADSAKAQDLTRQVEAEQAMHDQNNASDEAGAVAPAPPAVNGYGEQSQVLDQTGPGLQRYNDENAEADHAERDAAAANNGEVTPEGLETSGPFSSTYPDPSVFVRQRIGMGYYEQDDTPDKILFDPYQAPSEESMKMPDSDVSEYVKRSIRAAKRKAKRENEDPDFIVGRSHYKRPRLTQQADMLESMDPALFNSPVIPAAAFSAETGDGTRPGFLSETPASTSGPAPQKRQALPRFDANEPALRHAKPRASYVELEDADLEDLEDEGATPAPESPTAGRFGPDGGVGVGSDDRTTSGAVPSSAAARPGAVEAPSGVPIRRRGRPPKRLSATGVAGAVAPAGSTSTPATGKRRRGRPRKSGLDSVLVRPANDTIGDGIADGAVGEGGLSVVPAPATEKRRRGRPRKSDVGSAVAGHGGADGVEAEDKLDNDFVHEAAAQARSQAPQLAASRRRRSGITTIAAASDDVEAESEVASDAGPSAAAEAPSPNGETASMVKRSGGPKRLAAPPMKGSSSTTGHQYLSMAERMALRGKKFKIGRRRRGGGDSSAATEKVSSPAGEADGPLTESVKERPRSTAAEELDEGQSHLGGGDGTESRLTESIPHQSAPWVAGASEGERDSPGEPTIVLPADAESEGYVPDEASSSSAICSGDEDDIPSGRARSPRQMRRGSRGRGRGRPSRRRGRMAR